MTSSPHNRVTKKRRQTIVRILIVLVVLFCVFWLFPKYALNRVTRPAHPLYADYVATIDNAKCGYDVATRRMMNGDTAAEEYLRENILNIPNELGISHKRALEMFRENYEQWKIGGNDNQVGAWKNCGEEAGAYLRFAITTLEHEIATNPKSRWEYWWEEFTWRMR